MIERILAVAGGIVARVAAVVAVRFRRKAVSDGATAAAGTSRSEVPELSPPTGPKPDVGTPAARSEAADDDLRSIKGIGAVSAERLWESGVTTFAQIAAWSPEDIEVIAGTIKVSSQRILREDWVGQAQSFTEGDSE
jgi:large subunit ribosomal protein L21